MGFITSEFDSVRNLQKETHDDGSVIYTHNGLPHRNDGPAIITADGSQHWYRNGERHRENGPAIEFADGSRHWYQNDALHRARGAAIEEPDGTRHWYHHGQVIALDDKAGFDFLRNQRANRHVQADSSRLANGEPLAQERMLTLDRGMGL